MYGTELAYIYNPKSVVTTPMLLSLAPVPVSVLVSTAYAAYTLKL